MCIYARTIFACNHELCRQRIRLCTIGEDFKNGEISTDCNLVNFHGLKSIRSVYACPSCAQGLDEGPDVVREEGRLTLFQTLALGEGIPPSSDRDATSARVPNTKDTSQAGRFEKLGNRRRTIRSESRKALLRLERILDAAKKGLKSEDVDKVSTPSDDISPPARQSQESRRISRISSAGGPPPEKVKTAKEQQSKLIPRTRTTALPVPKTKKTSLPLPTSTTKRTSLASKIPQSSASRKP